MKLFVLISLIALIWDISEHYIYSRVIEDYKHNEYSLKPFLFTTAILYLISLILKLLSWLFGVPLLPKLAVLLFGEENVNQNDNIIKN
jgi:hypothetical protein